LIHDARTYVYKKKLNLTSKLPEVEEEEEEQKSINNMGMKIDQSIR